MTYVERDPESRLKEIKRWAERKNSDSKYGDLVVGLILGVPGAFVIGYAILGEAATKIGNYNAIIVSIIGILFLGVALYIFRRKYRALYGYFEILTALALGGLTVARTVHFRPVTFADLLKSPDSLTTLLGLFSSIYIVVRGLDNISEGRKYSENKSSEISPSDDKTNNI
jgi:hypothetical protein